MKHYPRGGLGSPMGVLLIAVAVVLVAASLSAVLPASAKPVPATVAGAAAPDERVPVADGFFDAHVPAGPSGVGVVVLHSLGNGAEEAARQGWSALADRQRFVGIYPERGTSWNAGLCCGSAAATDRDDVGWLAQVVQIASARYHLTTVYLAGFSNGGMMVERLVAERPALSDRFAVWGAAPEMPKRGVWKGRGTAFAGELDNIVPSQGGTLVIGDRLTRVRPAVQTRDYLAGADLELVRVPGLGHAVPPDWPERAWAALSAPPPRGS